MGTRLSAKDTKEVLVSAEYYAVVYPVLKDGKFVWVMKLTQTQVIFSHLMEVPAKIKEPKIQPPTPQTLPPIEALVGTKKKKK